MQVWKLLPDIWGGFTVSKQFRFEAPFSLDTCIARVEEPIFIKRFWLRIPTEAIHVVDVRNSLSGIYKCRILMHSTGTGLRVSEAVITMTSKGDDKTLVQGEAAISRSYFPTFVKMILIMLIGAWIIGFRLQFYFPMFLFAFILIAIVWLIAFDSRNNLIRTLQVILTRQETTPELDG